MEESAKRKLVEMLDKIGFDSIILDCVVGQMVFLGAIYDGNEIEAVFNIASSDLVYRNYDPYDKTFGHWKEV